ncbi:hypothetical protein H6G80_17730 [Nostoc sp. FACHB-87]|uniref:P-loop NTPase fold protein n=1 Tax=Nostocaceae TaxID=1162 RepID=UPI001687612A|nr:MULTISPECIES: P-loop NTPase fold protein [Nostocaceae]MBD2455913.1 hypothetical protein [Nostoc sp. FACHB-87]MBD2474499.1 hypothetical protein [Anabaena sp. FACHB-83]
MNESVNTLPSGVNRQEAESLLKKFLNNPNYKVLAVKGKWGVGKTYLVHKVLYENNKEYYGYASVFGISSIEQLKARILANYNNVATNIQAKNKSFLTYINKFLNDCFEWINRNSGRLERTPKIDLVFSGQSSIPVTGTLISIAGDLALNIFFNTIKNSIICIDDLERKSKLPLDELLGFVEYLVQELKCKIILIYSDDNLDTSSQEILQIYREKVIDREFTLAPTVKENLDFIFKEHLYIEVIKPVLINAGTNNIRVLRKTKWLIDELIPLINNWQPSLRNQVIKNSIVINISKLDTEFRQLFSITTDRILSLTNSSKYKNNDSVEEYMQLTQKLSYLGYEPLDIDELIISSLETSMSNSAESEFLKIGNSLNEREKNNQIIEKLNNLGKSYYNSFANSKEEISEEIIHFLEEHHLDISISEFERIENLASIIELDISQYERALLKHKLKDEPHYFNDLNIFRTKLRKYPELEAYLEEQKNQYLRTLDITTAIKNIINSDSLSISPWEKENFEFLNNRTVEEYTQWLEKGHPDLYLMIKRFLTFGLPASQKLEEAIRILAKKSKLNKIRAKFLYNIDIDNLPNTNDEN